MKRNFTYTLAAVALAGVFSSAQAATVNLNEADVAYDLGSNPSDENVYFVTHDAGSFSDVYTFSLTEFTDTIASAVSLYLPGLNGGVASYDIIDQSIALFSDPEGDGAAGLNTQIGSAVFDNKSGILSASALAAGNYYLAIAGNAIGTQGGVYQFAMNTAPIPEPETSALMLAGLGLLGFVGKRRMNQYSAVNFV